MHKNQRAYRHHDENNKSFFQVVPVMFIANMYRGRVLCMSWLYWTVELFTVQRWDER